MPLSETIRSVEKILSGQMDDVNESELMYLGALP